ncbi:MAG: 23S rRNA (guanosine(2251)-2'-O)-methyltransferase RlmB, partial [Candidatus Shikimatogenerans sp. JK-2022]|nr:23S rRNA (guanosine(2251)-2'-O)-methyltransferase RlmB [Candidatus Shikimatogenerans bostrichidophilus]
MLNSKNNIIIYGYNTIKEALKSNLIKIVIIFINIIKLNIKKYKILIKNIKKQKIPFKILKKDKFDNKYKNKNKNLQGLVANIFFKKKFNLNDIIEKNKKLKLIILILYNITDTKNISSIIRTSLCFNVNFIILPKNYYIYNSKIIKISSGAILKIPICRVNNLVSSIKYLIKNNIQILCITEKSNNNIINYNKENNSKKSVALIFGNEEYGINKKILNISSNTFTIKINKSQTEFILQYQP